LLVLIATRAHLVIDGSGDGLPSAPGYYRVFPKEPSPLGDLSFAPATTTVMAANTSLDAALTSMIRAGSGGAVVLVCHAIRDGLLLSIISREMNHSRVSDDSTRGERTSRIQPSLKSLAPSFFLALRKGRVNPFSITSWH
jgi:hypothetical protein